MRVKITVPNDLSEIKLWQYQKFVKIQEDNTDENFLASKMIEIFCGISLKEAYTLKAKDVHRITGILADMFEQKPHIKTRFVLNGVEYGFIPNLDDMTLGEYVDLDTYLGKWQQVEKAMAVLYRPIINTYKNKYTIEEYKAEGQDVYKDMPMDIVLGSMLFFLSFRNRLVEAYDSLFGTEQGEALTSVSQFGQKWGWYQSIFALSQGDIRRFEHIVELNVHKCLTMLSFMKEKSELESKQLKNRTR